MKTKMCLELGIKLLHVKESDWKNKKSEIKKEIKKFLYKNNINNNKINN